MRRLDVPLGALRRYPTGVPLTLGLTALAAGIVFYACARPAGILYLQQVSGQALDNTPHYGRWTLLFGCLPEFLHPFAFSLLAGALVPRRRKWHAVVCLIFLFQNLLFEFGQLYSRFFIDIVPGWFASIPILQNTRSFFAKGTFDMFDVAAAILGSVLAFLILDVTRKAKEASL